jgi:hypothetical protein
MNFLRRSDALEVGPGVFSTDVMDVVPHLRFGQV